jgi:Anti-sigma-28 factor, FlgM
VDMEPKDPCVMLSDVERERVYRVRKAVAEGTYEVSADALAATLIQSMLEFHYCRSLPSTDSLQTEVEPLLLDRRRDRSG